MACMEYECRRCGHFWSNNRPLGLEGCPRCCSQNVRKDFDEPATSGYLDFEEFELNLEQEQAKAGDGDHGWIYPNPSPEPVFL